MKQGQPTTPGSPSFTSVKDVDAHTKSRMDKVLSDLQHEMSGIRTGRASISLFDHVKADYYGTPTPLNQLATLHVPEPSLITIQPWDISQIGAIEKDVRSSDLGLNPNNDGKIIRVPIPPLTEERRKDLIKVVRHEAENARVAVRNLRRDANHALKEAVKAKTISEDEDRRAEEEIQKLTNCYIAEIDKALAQKETDLMAV